MTGYSRRDFLYGLGGMGMVAFSGLAQEPITFIVGRGAASPIIVKRPEGGLRQFIRGVDNIVYTAQFRRRDIGWSGWESMSYAVMGEFAVAYTEGAFHLLNITLDGIPTHYNSRTETWVEMGGRVYETPALVAVDEGLVAVARGVDNTFNFNVYRQGEWSEWRSRSITTQYTPMLIVEETTNTVHCVGLTVNNDPWHYPMTPEDRA